jgi:hypothetical protein
MIAQALPSRASTSRLEAWLVQYVERFRAVSQIHLILIRRFQRVFANQDACE